MRPLSPLWRGDGVTLVELLVSLALIGVVLALTMPFAHVQKRLWERAEERRETERALAGALHWLTRDLQQAGYHESGPALLRVGEDSLSYLLSRDEDDPAGFSADNRRLITFWLDGRDLKYRIQAPLAAPAAGWERGSTQVLASGIESMRCRGLDRAGAEAESPSRVVLVECALSGPRGALQRAVVRLRVVTVAARG